MNTNFDTIERRMPFSLEAEQSLLGSIMIDPSCMDRLAAVIGADDFAETTGDVSVTLDKADSYTGNLSFTFALKNLGD